MAKRKLREQKECLNCGTIVEDRFCPHCGQENIVNRPSFVYLFGTFIKDFFNYDTSFWHTMRTLIGRPGIIVNEYLAGKRKSYVNPIKLYFFVSLVTFLLPSLTQWMGGNDRPELTDTTETKTDSLPSQINSDKVLVILDSIQQTLPEGSKLDSVELLRYEEGIRHALEKQKLKKRRSGGNPALVIGGEDGSHISMGNYPKYKHIKTVKEFDEFHASLPKEERMDFFMKPLYRKTIELEERGIMLEGDFREKFMNSFMDNLPKVLIFYLPIFAFILWLFHGKKRWKYYDHGVFTLYYFALLLLLVSFNILFNALIFWPSDGTGILETIAGILSFLAFLGSFGYAFFYFFRSHRRIYGESKAISRTKSFFIFWINFWLIIVAVVGYTMVTFLMI